MPAKVVRLSVHKNNRAQKTARRYRRAIADCGAWAARNFDAPLSGYCVVMWTGEAEATAFWDGTDKLGPSFLEDHVKTIVRRSIARKVTNQMLGAPDDAC